ncbi:hypothetical protein CJ030_MR7G014286 [Morella rubra]|uniref:Midasin n=1 Tax=Morella rubra TaxID=262757 RepID=A0A6A1V0Q1_9ROSI|nr:hypothetical protein CJ030_MR7G014286 [Morella rubra]
MTMDGSFGLQSALERFLGRCPKLLSFPQIDSLAKKGHVLTEEEVVNVMAEVFLHPNYTIPLIGCFRPIARKIVDKAVALLRMVPNLRSKENDTLAEVEEDEVLNEVASVIELYNRAGRGLDLHEFVCLAACRALDFAPFLLGPILDYFKFAPPPFERILMEVKSFELCGKVGTCVLRAARTSYRLLLLNSEIFSKLWDWSCFLDLVKQSSTCDPSRGFGNEDSVIADIRWCGIQILSVVLKMSCRPTVDFSMEAEAAFTCLLRWEEFCLDTSLEKAGWYIQSPEQNRLSSPSSSIDFTQENCLQSSGLCSSAISSSGFHEIELPTQSKRLTRWGPKSVGNLFVPTSAVKKSFEMVVLAVSQKWPVLLYGPAGAGKSALINKLTLDSGNEVVS